MHVFGSIDRILRLISNIVLNAQNKTLNFPYQFLVVRYIITLCKPQIHFQCLLLTVLTTQNFRSQKDKQTTTHNCKDQTYFLTLRYS